MRKNSVLFVVATLVVASMMIGCGGGSSTPTSPKPVGTPTPTPVPVQPSISLSATIPGCGATIPSGGTVKVRVYIVAGPGDYFVEIRLLDASGNTVDDGVDSPRMTGTGFYDLILKGPRQPATSVSFVLNLYTGSTVLASQPNTCGWIWQ